MCRLALVVAGEVRETAVRLHIVRVDAVAGEWSFGAEAGHVEEESAVFVRHLVGDHAEVLGCFERWRIEAREYTLAHIAFYRAIEDTTNLEAIGNRLPPIRKQNAKFLRELDDNGSYYFSEWTTKESALVEQRKRRK